MTYWCLANFLHHWSQNKSMANWPLKGHWVLNSDMYVSVYINDKTSAIIHTDKK